MFVVQTECCDTSCQYYVRESESFGSLRAVNCWTCSLASQPPCQQRAANNSTADGPMRFLPASTLEVMLLGWLLYMLYCRWTCGFTADSCRQRFVMDTFVQVQGLDGYIIDVPLGPGPVQPGSKFTVRGKGMPVSKQPGQQGDLVVNIKVNLPKLSELQKERVKGVL